MKLFRVNFPRQEQTNFSCIPRPDYLVLLSEDESSARALARKTLGYDDIMVFTEIDMAQAGVVLHVFGDN